LLKIPSQGRIVIAEEDGRVPSKVFRITDIDCRHAVAGSRMPYAGFAAV
jgi:hypothetical protein